MMRRPYKIPARFLRDSGITSTLRWEEARPDALTLDRTSIIESEDWSNDRGMWPDRIGEQDGRRVFEAADAPPGSGRGHVCGSDEDFDTGGLYEPDRPPVEYDSFGIPVCCAGARRFRGGAAAGGRSAVTIRLNRSYGGAGASGRSPTTPVTPIAVYGGAGASGRSPTTPVTPIAVYGGAGASGRSPTTPVTPIAVYGGAGASGRAVVAVSPGCGGFGGFCEFAYLDDLDQWCEWDTTVKFSRWRKWSVSTGETYRFELFVQLNGGHTWHLYTGSACEGKTLITAGDFFIAHQTVEFVALGSVVWWNLGAQVGPGYSAGFTRLTLVP